MPRLMLTLGFAFLSGCTTFPEGQSIRALPGTGKTFEEFRAADDACRQHSLERVQGPSGSGYRPGDYPFVSARLTIFRLGVSAERCLS